MPQKTGIKFTSAREWPAPSTTEVFSFREQKGWNTGAALGFKCGHSNLLKGGKRKEGRRGGIAVCPPTWYRNREQIQLLPTQTALPSENQRRRLGRWADTALLSRQMSESEPSAGGGRTQQERGNCPAGDRGKIVRGWRWRKINCSGSQIGTLLLAT